MYGDLFQTRRLIIRAACSLAWLLMVIPCATAAEEYYSGGTGEPNNPFRISTVADWQELVATPADWDRHFILTADIDLNDVPITPIGNDANNFTGIFDGNDHLIRNIDINTPEADYVGLFGYVGPGAHIHNVGVEDLDIRGDDYVGGLAGSNHGTIGKCYAIGSVEGGDRVGCLVGWNDGGHIADCYATGAVTGEFFVGGLAGQNNSWISCCFSTARVSGDEQVGGLTGSSRAIENSYATGPVDGNSYVGGLSGRSGGANIIRNCYASGKVDGNDYVGGLIGYGDAAVNCFWNIDTSAQLQSAGGRGRETSEMTSMRNFIGWNCCGDGPVWTLDEGRDSPRLAWEGKPGHPIPEFLLSDFLTGEGTAEYPYEIRSAVDLQLVGVFVCEWARHFKLMADIDLQSLKGTEYNIIGHSSSSVAFSGTFDGNGHAIRNFTYEGNAHSRIALFGYANADIKDLELINVEIRVPHADYAAPFVGYLNFGSVQGCATRGGSVEGRQHVGGLVGRNRRGVIDNCYSTASIKGDTLTGGLAGYNSATISNSCVLANVVAGGPGALTGWNSGDIWNCCASGNVIGYERTGGLASTCSGDGTIRFSRFTGYVEGGNQVGGIVGANGGIIQGCVATADVKGLDDVGGLVGRQSDSLVDCYMYGTVEGRSRVGGLAGKVRYAGLTHCYARACISGEDLRGGVAGYSENGAYTACFWDTDVGGSLQGVGSGDESGVIGITTDQMRTSTPFTDAGWDFVDTWAIYSSRSYPKFVWQVPVGDVVCPDGVNGPDFAVLARYWHETNCAALDDCEGADTDFSGGIDFADVAAVAESWLSGL